MAVPKGKLFLREHHHGAWSRIRTRHLAKPKYNLQAKVAFINNIDSCPQIFEESPSDHDNNSQVIPSSEYNRDASGTISLYP